MKGFFAIGAEGISKPPNLGALIRTGHAFGASYVYSVAPATDAVDYGSADTSEAARNLPFYRFPTVADLVLPQGASLIGVELLDDAVELPSFRHPRQAIYVLGPERGGLSDAMIARCDHVVKIPTQFSINVSLAGALVLYDRMISLGRFAPRPVRAGGPTESLEAHVHGAIKFRTTPTEMEPES
jgi:tRNA G18 (ribose-2'-O)-methylase SpoU